MNPPLQVPEWPYLTKIGLIVFLVAELEGLLKSDMVRFRHLLPPELDFASEPGYEITGMPTRRLGEYFAAHGPKSRDAALGQYYRRGGEALIEIAPKRNAMLHSVPGIDGNDPEQKLRLMRWRISTKDYEAPHMISDEWLDAFEDQIIGLRQGVVAIRPSQS